MSDTMIAPPVAPVTPVTPPAAPAPNATPFYSEWYGSDGKFNANAWDRLPEDLRGLKTEVSRFGTPEDLLRSYQNKMVLAGRKGLDPLPENAPENVRAERDALLRKALLVPDKPEGYGVKRPDDLPEGAWNETLAKSAAEIMQKGLVAPGVAKQLMELQAKTVMEGMRQQQEGITQFFDAQSKLVKDTWTKEGIDYNKGIDAARQVARTYGIDPDKDPEFKSAKVQLMLQRIKNDLGEDRLVTSDSDPQGTFGESDLSKAADIRSNKQNPYNAMYWDNQHPRHKEVVGMVQRFTAEGLRKQQVQKGAVR